MFVTFLVLIATMCAGMINAGSVDLTHTTLSQQIGAHKTLVVMFYAPWCSYSKEALPIWEELADSMARNSEDKNILVAKVDCVAEPDAYWQENIKSFPTIKAYVNHNTIPIVYDGERVANTMWRYFRILNKQYVEEITTVQEFLNLQVSKLTSTKPLVLALLSSQDSLTDDNERNRKIDGACKKADRVTCVISRNVELGASLGLTFPSVTIYTAFDSTPVQNEDTEPYQAPVIDMPVTRRDLDELTGSELADWLTNLSYPPLVELTAESSDLVFSQQRAGFENHFLFLLNDLTSPEGQQRLENIRNIGRTMQGKAVVIYIDMHNLSSYCAEVLKSLQVDVGAHAHHSDGAPLDTLHAVVSKTSSMNFYAGLHLDSAFQEGHTVVSWMEGVLAGLVAPERTTTHEQ